MTNGSECQTGKRWWLWKPELRKDGGFERQIESGDDSERRDWEEIVALNAKAEKWLWLWMPKLRSGDDSERWDWEEIVALNAETKKK